MATSGKVDLPIIKGVTGQNPDEVAKGQFGAEGRAGLDVKQTSTSAEPA
jgi:hypothetical protein